LVSCKISVISTSDAIWNSPDFFLTLHQFVPKVFLSIRSPHLFDMSYNSSHLRTNSINFSSISLDKEEALIASKHSTRSGGDIITVQNGAGSGRFGPVPSRQTFSLGDGTELRRDGDFLSVWTSPFNYKWEKFTERWRSATERKRDV
jgi:hypothetical protein